MEKIFAGILQYTKEQFNQLIQEKGENNLDKGIIYFVRENPNDNLGNAEIWFGNRRYASHKNSGGVEDVLSIIESNEKVTASALVDLDTRMKNTYTKEQTDNNIAAKILELEEGVIAFHDNDIKTLQKEVISNEKVTVAGLNDLRIKMENLGGNIYCGTF